VGGGAQDVDAAGGVFDDREDVQTGSGQRFDEVGGQQRLGLRAEEVGPGGGGPVRRGIDTGLAQDLPDRGGGELDSEGEQFVVDAPVAPAAVLAGQP
jgi:hypothetical protein